MYEYNMTYPNELYHYGVKGMKWGVRRYQNYDGSLTNAGKKRLAKEEKKLDKLNGVIFQNRLAARRLSADNDPSAVILNDVLSERVKTKIEQGQKIVDNMKKKGLLSDNATFKQYTADYERRLFDGCKQYIKDVYNLKEVTDDDVNYFLEAYMFGAI